LLLLGIGIKNLFWGNAPSPRIRLIIGLTLAGQLVLHLLYGEETFLYSLHYLPLLIATAALAAIGQFRKISLILALIVLCGGGINNLVKFREARNVMILHFYPERGGEVRVPVLDAPTGYLMEDQFSQSQQRDVLLELKTPALILDNT
jgi:hypothetical protein